LKAKEMCMVGVIGVVAVLLCAAMPVRADAAVISAGGYYSWNTTLNSGDSWYFSVQATDGVDILVMDESNYQVYSAGGTPFVNAQYTKYSMSQYSFTISGLTGTYYIVVKSNNLFFDQTINYENSITRYTPPVTNPDPFDTTDDGGETPGFDLPIILVATVASVGIFTVMRRRK